MTRYVQHKSGQGRIFRVDEDNMGCWEIYVSDLEQHCWVPKSEYVVVSPPVPAPDRWVDVTESCHLGADALCAWHNHNCVLTVLSGYRLRKVPICTGNGAGHEATKQWAFIVERREP